MPLRRSAVAGRWYPGDRRSLVAELDAYLLRADVEPRDGPPRAIVAPHAGLTYSGPVAAFAYKAVAGGTYGSIILVGPSHFVSFPGVSLWSEGSWETPLGSVAVDEKLARSLRDGSPEIVDLAEAHQREHSLEMQLPFIGHLMPGIPIVPLVMGHQSRETAFALGDALARTVRAHEGSSNRPVLIVASSDLSHYEDARVARALDSVVLDCVEALAADTLMDALEREPRHACGGGPMVAVIRAARQLGADTAHVLRYADSGDVSGDKSSVVGYMAAAIW